MSFDFSQTVHRPYLFAAEKNFTRYTEIETGFFFFHILFK